MTEFVPPVPENLRRNLPIEIRESRQFTAWQLKGNGKKIPLAADGRSFGDYQDPHCWKTLDEAIRLVERQKAFGVGLVIASPEQAQANPGFNLVTGLIAVDADAKRSPDVIALHIPEHLVQPVRSLNTYAEFSTSQKGLRALAFGTVATDKQNITKSFRDGTEISLYPRGWVTLSGLPLGGTPATIERRQGELDRLVGEFWPRTDKPIADNAGDRTNEPGSLIECYTVDWSRMASAQFIARFLHGLKRSPEQARNIRATWDLRRGWNHGGTPDASMYTNRIVQEGLWLQPYFGWTLQDVVDLVVTFCRRHHLPWSPGRARKQINDGLAYILKRRAKYPVNPLTTYPHPPLTGDADKTEHHNFKPTSPLNTLFSNKLQSTSDTTSTDTLAIPSAVNASLKVSVSFRHKSAPRDAVLRALDRHRNWVKAKTIARETGRSREAARKQLDRLVKRGVVCRDGEGRYRIHHPRRRRPLKPCALKPFPKSRTTGVDRKTLTRGELKKRGWPSSLIDKFLPTEEQDYRYSTTKNLDGQCFKFRAYWVSRIKTIERDSAFEEARENLRSPAPSVVFCRPLKKGTRPPFARHRA